MNKKGSILDIIIWIVSSFVIIMFFAMFIYGFGILNTTMNGLPTMGNIDLAEVSSQTIGQVNSALSALRWISFVMIITLGFSILLTNALMKSNPFWFFLHVLMTIIAVIVSTFVSNAYEGLMVNNIIGETLVSFQASSFIMLYLPTFAAIIGIFGAIFLFINIQRDPDTIGASII